MTRWIFPLGHKRHTQDGSQLVSLMKSIGLGRKPVLAVDVGCGDGIIAHDILLHRKATTVFAFDIERDCIEAAKLNLSESLAQGTVQLMRRSARLFFDDKKNWDRFDRFVINPPFFVSGSGLPNKRQPDQRARHESSLALKLWVRGARRLLRTGGELYCVFPTERLAELLHELSRNGVEPKELWWFKEDHRRRRVFLRAVRGARTGVTVHFDFA